MGQIRERTYVSGVRLLVSDEGLRAFKPIQVQTDYVTGNEDDVAVLPAGTFIAENTNEEGTYIPLGRLLAKADAPNTQDWIEFPFAPTVFTVGEDLLLADDTVLGTVKSIDFENRRVMLEANLQAAVTAGDTVKQDDAYYGAIIGFTISDQDVLSPHGSDTVSTYHAATVYEARMPFIDAALKTQFEDLLFW